MKALQPPELRHSDFFGPQEYAWAKTLYECVFDTEESESIGKAVALKGTETMQAVYAAAVQYSPLGDIGGGAEKAMAVLLLGSAWNGIGSWVHGGQVVLCRRRY
jgi:hypothetical protein